MATRSGHFVFRYLDKIGANDAESDQRFLEFCFEDTGNVQILTDVSRPECIVVGRTGAGKSALLLEIAKRKGDFCIQMDPEKLSFNHVANSTAIQTISDFGINLDPFYKLLWRHTIAVTILQEKFAIVDVESQRKFVEYIKGKFESRDRRKQKEQSRKKREKVLDYLNEWQDKFFEEVEYRIVAVTTKFETEVANAVQEAAGIDIRAGAKGLGLRISDQCKSNSKALDRTAEDITQEVRHKAQSVINKIHAQQLMGILELLDDVIDDPGKPVYVLVDKLDEDWADESIRYRMLRGLLDTVKEFRNVSNAKLIVALRKDLLERLFRECRTDAGFQEDKFRDFQLPLRWHRLQLRSIIDKRVSHLIKDRYTKANVSFEDIAPRKVKFKERRVDTFEFIADHTWGRPRDFIEFLNICISKAESSSRITKQMIMDSLGEYSRNRFRSICQEWFRDYPSLPLVAKKMLSKKKSVFRLSEIADQQVEDLALEVQDGGRRDGRLEVVLNNVFIGKTVPRTAICEIFTIFYKVGFVGLKPISTDGTRWASEDSISVSPAELNDESSVRIHKGIWKVMGVDGDYGVDEINAESE